VSSGAGNLSFLTLSVASPNSFHFAIGGDDKFIRKYDIMKNRMEKAIILRNKVRALDWSKDGKLIIAADV
jgi:hypothetical protein